MVLVINKYYNQVNIEQLHQLKETNICKKLNQIFLLNKADLSEFNAPFIFYDSPFLSDKVQGLQLSVIKEIGNKLGRKFKLNLHPSSLLIKKEVQNYITKSSMTIEAQCLNENISKQTVISIMSTVGITPILMFGQSPRVIMLYRLIDIKSLHQLNSVYFNFIELFVKKYKEKITFYIPESKSELFSILEIINSSIKEN